VREISEQSSLDPTEIDRLLEGARAGPYGPRDYAMLLLLSRHALRVSELCELRKADLDLRRKQLLVRDEENGGSRQHRLDLDEIRALDAYLNWRGKSRAPWLFPGRRGKLSRQLVFLAIQVAADAAGFSSAIYPRMLRAVESAPSGRHRASSSPASRLHP
jgi:integrase